MTYPLSRDFKIGFDDLRVVARGLNRPECVVALASGSLLAAHGGGGYSHIDLPTGRVEHVLAADTTRRFVPNGIALGVDGKVLFADLGGGESGGLFALDRHGALTTVLTEVDGEALPPSNYVMVDAHGVVWFSVSTRKVPRTLAWNHEVTDGYIGVIDSRGARIVADGLGYTNEVALSPDGRWLYTNETYAQRISRFAILPGPALGPREVVARLAGADLPDGLTFDVHGGVWLTCIASNRLLVLRPDGDLQTVLEDSDPEHVARVVDGIRSCSLSSATMQTAGRSRLGNISSIAFGAPDMRTGYLGCLLDDCIRAFDSPVAGLVQAHWTRRLAA